MTTQLVKPIKAQPRLVTAVLLGVILWYCLPGRQSTRLLAAWDGSTALYLVGTGDDVPLEHRPNPRQGRRAR